MIFKNFYLILLALCFSVSASKIDFTKKQIISAVNNANIEIPIKVLLDKRDTSNQVLWKIESESGLIVICPRSGKKTVFSKNFINIKSKSKKFYLNNQKYLQDTLIILPTKGFLKYKDNFFEGFFVLSRYKNHVYLVNHLELEDYVSIVLQSESWPGWPDEVNKALSICMRSYGVAKIIEHRKKKECLPYDIKSTTMHQVYQGSNDPSKLKHVVNQTVGLVLTYNNAPITAMFDISCGGVTPSSMSGFDFDKAPYLNRSYPCLYCKDFKSYKWQNVYSFAELESKLKILIPNFNKLSEMKVYQKDKAGVVLAIRVKDGSRWYQFSGSEIRSLLNLKSLCFTISIKKQEIILDGKGFGHLIGLCQLGLRQMMKENPNWTYSSALSFFYPHTKLMKITKKSFY